MARWTTENKQLSANKNLKVPTKPLGPYLLLRPSPPKGKGKIRDLPPVPTLWDTGERMCEA